MSYKQGKEIENLLKTIGDKNFEIQELERIIKTGYKINDDGWYN